MKRHAVVCDVYDAIVLGFQLCEPQIGNHGSVLKPLGDGRECCRERLLLRKPVLTAGKSPCKHQCGQKDKTRQQGKQYRQTAAERLYHTLSSAVSSRYPAPRTVAITTRLPTARNLRRRKWI